MSKAGQIRRRRNQPNLEQLPLFTRFLNHLVAQRGLTQAALADMLPNCSPSTLSRWFRGEIDPLDTDLEAIALALAVPVSTLQALRLLESLRKGPMLATVAAWRYMVDGPGKRLVLIGATMHAGMVHLLDARPAGKAILVSLYDPCGSPSPLVTLEQKHEAIPSGTSRAHWLASLGALRAATRVGQDTHARLWVRPADEFVLPSGLGTFVGQLAANDWIAVVAPPVPDASLFAVHFFGDPAWNALVQPSIDLMEADVNSSEHTLIWDSRWASDAPQMALLRERLEAVVGALSVETLMR